MTESFQKLLKLGKQERYYQVVWTNDRRQRCVRDFFTRNYAIEYLNTLILDLGYSDARLTVRSFKTN